MEKLSAEHLESDLDLCSQSRFLTLQNVFTMSWPTLNCDFINIVD